MQEFEQYLKDNKILFAKVQDLPDYQNSENDRVHKNTVKYKGCHEIENFLPHDDGYVYGYTELNYKKINIKKLGAAQNDKQVDHCLVIFVSDASKIIGYYLDATIYDDCSRNYCFKAKASNAILLKGEDRIKIKQKEKLHMGQSFLKYADEKNIAYVKNIIEQLVDIPYAFQEQSNDSGLTISEKKMENEHLVKEGRIPTSKVLQLKEKLGCKCSVCGFEFKQMYGDIGDGFIELHHLIPYSKLDKGKSRKLTEDDFVVLCSNCHRMIHRLKEPCYNRLDVKAMRKLILKR